MLLPAGHLLMAQVPDSRTQLQEGWHLAQRCCMLASRTRRKPEGQRALPVGQGRVAEAQVTSAKSASAPALQVDGE
jgi:hypothetical protein